MRVFLRAATSSPVFVRMLAAAILLSGVAAPANAAPPGQLRTQAPGYFRLMIGDFEVTALYDGYLDIPTTVLKGIDEKSIHSLLARRFTDTKAGIQTPVNAYLVNTGDNLVLVDVGASDCMTPELGTLSDNLRASGYRPEQVDTILLTHLHPDHVCGLSRDGKALYPNAAVYASHNEEDYWLKAPDVATGNSRAEREKGRNDVKPVDPALAKKARDALAPYLSSGRFNSYGIDETLVPGVQAIASSGHTPGHTGYLFTSNTERLLIWGDIVHNHAVQFTYPDVSVEYDVDPKQAIVSRRRVLTSVAKDSPWIAGAHLPFPGLGHVTYDGERYRWVPVDYGPVVKPPRAAAKN